MFHPKLLLLWEFISSLFKDLLQYRYQKENLRERDHLINPGLDGRIILR
jgi:hypothetical protein